MGGSYETEELTTKSIRTSPWNVERKHGIWPWELRFLPCWVRVPGTWGEKDQAEIQASAKAAHRGQAKEAENWTEKRSAFESWREKIVGRCESSLWIFDVWLWQALFSGLPILHSVQSTSFLSAHQTDSFRVPQRLLDLRKTRPYPCPRWHHDESKITHQSKNSPRPVTSLGVTMYPNLDK